MIIKFETGQFIEYCVRKDEDRGYFLSVPKDTWEHEPEIVDGGGQTRWLSTAKVDVWL